MAKTYEQRIDESNKRRMAGIRPPTGYPTFTLRRVIPQDECPGTCCHRHGIFPTEATKDTHGHNVCRYWNDSVAGRRYGGCTIWEDADRQRAFNLDFSTDAERTAAEEKWLDSCKEWPIPRMVQAVDVTYRGMAVDFCTIPTKKNEDYETNDVWCECFRWEHGRQA